MVRLLLKIRLESLIDPSSQRFCPRALKVLDRLKQGKHLLAIFTSSGGTFPRVEELSSSKIELELEGPDLKEVVIDPFSLLPPPKDWETLYGFLVVCQRIEDLR